MTEKAILSGSPKLPSDLKGHKTHPKKPSHGKAKQSLHLSAACCSCVAVPRPRAELTHSSCSQQGRGRTLKRSRPSSLPQEHGLGQLQSTGQDWQDQTLSIQCQFWPLTTTKGSHLSLLLQAGGSFCSSHPQGLDMESFCPYCWGDAAFISNFFFASCFQTCSGSLLFPILTPKILIVQTQLFTFCCSTDVGEGEMQVEHHKSKRQVSFEGKGIWKRDKKEHRNGGLISVVLTAWSKPSNSYCTLTRQPVENQTFPVINRIMVRV